MLTEIRQEKIIGSRRRSNYFWSFFLLIGGLGFVLAGFSSYWKVNLLGFTDPTKLVFIPQGMIMIFYGTLSLGISLYNLMTIVLDVGSGYNEYNKMEQLVKIVRKGFPGKNREILLTYPFSSIRAIGIKITEGINPNRSIYLCLNDERKIPLTPGQDLLSISHLEEKAANLANFLDLRVENL